MSSKKRILSFVSISNGVPKVATTRERQPPVKTPSETPFCIVSVLSNWKGPKGFIWVMASKKYLGPFQFDNTETIQKGVSEGVLTGGCLSLVVATLGTPFEIETKDKILFLEDINEKAYKIDRMLTQLKLAGKLDDRSEER